MEIPKNIVKEKALEQLDGTIENESAKWAGRLAEKVEAEKHVIDQEFTEEQMKNYGKVSNFLAGKDQKAYVCAFGKLSIKEQEDYTAILDHKTAESKVNNAKVHLETSLSKINACVEVKELINASIAAK